MDIDVVTLKEEIMRLKERVELLENFTSDFNYSDRYIAQKDIQFLDGRNMIFAAGDTDGIGSRIGTAPNQFIGFFGADPVSQPSFSAAPDMISLGGAYVASDINTNFSQINAWMEDIVSLLRDLGLMGSP